MTHIVANFNIRELNEPGDGGKKSKINMFLWKDSLANDLPGRAEMVLDLLGTFVTDQSL